LDGGQGWTMNGWFKLLLWSRLGLACLGVAADGAAQQVIRAGSVEFSTDRLGGVPFGSISGLAIDSAHRVYVVDELLHRVQVLMPDGSLLTSFGRSGDGPGEFRGPCCAGLAPSGSLWVLSPDAQRMDGFVLDDTLLRPIARRSIRGTTFLYVDKRPPIFRRNERILVAVTRRGEEDTSRDHLLLEIDSTSTVNAEYRRVDASADSLGIILVPRPNGRSLAMPLPFGAGLVIAFAADGSYAQAVTSSYRVVHYELDGSIRYRIVREDVVGEPLTRDERTGAEGEVAALRERVERSGASMPRVRLPSVKPVLQGVWFDTTGRLWVRRMAGTAEGLARADVYSPSGRLLFEAVWPAGIDLGYGAIRGSTAWGVQIGEHGEHSLVRLRFR
jgi:hypothetical protein